jgi:NAD(P)-dependent dehydrogenase (short-subunit alcohol dehydrogenase family)
MKRLEGQVAWVSGSTMGIGEGIAKLFAREGACVAVIGLEPEHGQRVKADIEREGGKCIFIRCDVTQDDAVRQSISRTVEAFGGLHILVNNAGIQIVKPLHEFTEEMWDRQMGVNLKSVFLSFRHAFPHLRRNQRSYVVNIGSVSCFVGQALTPCYLATKGGILQLSKSIALDYARHGIRCNVVCPGITDTPMLWQHLNEEPNPQGHLEERLRRVPLGEILSPNDVAKAVLYFSCEDSAGITGTSLVVDGGYIAAAEWDTEEPA